MAKGNKPNKPKGGEVPTDATSKASAAEAARRRSKQSSKQSLPWLLSFLVLLVAIGATVLLTRSSAGAAPKAPDRTSAATVEGTGKASFEDKHFTPQSRDAQCESWADDKECENNPAFMLERCPSTCKGRAAQKRKKAKAKVDTPKDSNPNCGTWAAAGECDNNPTFMKTECAIACAGGGEAVEDLHQVCEPWV